MDNTAQVDQADVQKFRFWELNQGNESVADYYSKLRRCNEIVKFDEEQLKSIFLRGLTPENHISVAMFGINHKPEEILEMFEQKKEKETKLISAIKDYIYHPSDVKIDTGSDITFITENLAKRLGFKIVPISPEK